MWYIQVFNKQTNEIVIEITTELEFSKNSYVEYYKHYGFDVKVSEQTSLKI